MSSPISPAREAAQDEAGKLIEQRTLLKGWLARLDEQGGSAAPHLIERVRGDYRERLRQIGEQLGPHADGIRAELEAMREQLGTAEAALGEASDALGEAQLRHLIGEISAEQWSDQEPELQSALTAAEAESARIRGECDRVAELLAGIEGEAASVPPPTEDEVVPRADAADAPLAAAPADQSAAAEPTVAPSEGTAAGPEPAEPTAPSGSAVEEDGAEEAPWLALIDAVATDEAAEAEPTESEADERDFLQWVASAADDEEEEDDAEAGMVAGGTLDEDFGFLEELDRALAASSGTAAPPVQGNGRRVGEATTRATLLCRECGSTNDVRAWYCEICGAELS